MSIQDKVNQFLVSHNSKLQELSNRLHNTENQITYLQLEIRMLQENELPQAQASVVLDGTDAGQVNKLKKSLKKYQDELQEALENQIILTNAIHQLQVNAGEEATKLHRLLNEERTIVAKKQYAKMMHAKGRYIETLIEESKVIKEGNKLDVALQILLVASGRKTQVYSDNPVKSNISNNSLGRFGDTYLSMTHQELGRFIQGTYTASDVDYLKRYKDKKDLG
jgi:uncharacterized protein (DUF342 family)